MSTHGQLHLQLLFTSIDRPYTTACRVVAEENSNSVLPAPLVSCALMNRAKGPQGMAQGAATYGLFSLIFAFPSGQDDELDVVDIPVDARKTR